MSLSLSLSSFFDDRLIGAVPRSLCWMLLPWFYLLWGDTKKYANRAVVNAIFRLVALLGIVFFPVTLLINIVLALTPFGDVIVARVECVEAEDGNSGTGYACLPRE